MFAVEQPITQEIAANFTSEQDLINRSVVRLQEAGFEVLQVTDMTINIAGTAKTYDQAFGVSLVAEDRSTLKSGGVEDLATFIENPKTDRPGLIDAKGTPFEDVIEGVAIEEPYYLMAPAIFPPPVDYWHLDVPGDVAAACNAEKAHRSGITGKGIKVAMVDTGWYKHPYFTSRGYRAAPVVLGPGTSNPARDDSGHGTGESANIFAVAPDVELIPVKARLSGSLSSTLVNTKGAFDLAVAQNPHIITNSWGFSFRNGPLSAGAQALAASVAAAVAAGIVVCFSAGNGHWGFPGQHPDVISVGGVYLERDGSMRASNYASGFMSNIYPGRRVPDLSGLVGMRPKAIYIMLPLSAGSSIDVGNAGGSHPNGDETASNDGWAAFSGTSAASPQLAGAAALVKQACPRLTPAQVRSVLMSSARDVTRGTNAHGNTATAGPDTATGNGLVDAHKATLLAKLRCLRITPIVGPPIQPIAVGPVRPVRPITPVLPIRPIQPIQPIQPIRPIRPIGPGPIGPGPLESSGGAEEAKAAAAAGQARAQAEAEAAAGPGLSEEEIAALEKMVLDSDLEDVDIG